MLDWYCLNDDENCYPTWQRQIFKPKVLVWPGYLNRMALVWHWLNKRPCKQEHQQVFIDI